MSETVTTVLFDLAQDGGDFSGDVLHVAVQDFQGTRLLLGPKNWLPGWPVVQRKSSRFQMIPKETDGT